MMRDSKDENKPMGPLFPKRHINDFYDGGPKGPPRNKMALCQKDSKASPSQMLKSGSMAMLKLPSSTGLGGAVMEQPSSSTVGDAPQRMFPTVCCIPESSHLTEYYRSFRSTAVNLNSDPPRFETESLEIKNFQNKCVPGNPMLTTECSSLQPTYFSTFDVGHFGSKNREGMIKNNLTAPFEKPLSAGHKQANEICQYRLRDHQRNHTQKKHNIESRNSDLRLLVGSKNSSNPLAALNYAAAVNVKPLEIFNCYEKCSLLDQPSTSYCKAQLERETRKHDTSSIRETITRRCASSTDGNSNSLQALGDISGVLMNETNAEEKDDRQQLANADKKKDIADSWEDSIAGLLQTSNEVIRELGGTTFFLKARKTILNHQKIFGIQVFELHRLIMVQRLLSRSPQLRYRNMPLETRLSPPLPKPNVDVQMSNPSKNNETKALWGNIPAFTVHAEIGHPTQQSTSKTLKIPASSANDRLEPWCFPPPGNQWLVPVQSASEGLIYKPYTGPCPPNIGIMAPVSGNCGPISLSPIDRVSCLSSSKPEVGQISGTGPRRSYFQPGAMTLPSAKSSNLEIKRMKQCAISDKCWPKFSMDFSVPSQSSSGMRNQKNITSDSDMTENNKNRRADSFRELVALPLFPTTPSLNDSMERCDVERPRVIEAVPHTPRPVLKSATRVLPPI